MEPLLECVPQARAVEAAKQLAVERIFCAPPVVAQQRRGQRALHALLDGLAPLVDALEQCGFERAKLDAPSQARAAEIGPRYLPSDRYGALLGVVDHIAGMTDAYAVRTARRLGVVDLD